MNNMAERLKENINQYIIEHSIIDKQEIFRKRDSLVNKLKKIYNDNEKLTDYQLFKLCRWEFFELQESLIVNTKW